jgi:two-component system, OmpR family, phosphate regulon sensor histidine kinase PhoR
VSFTQRLLLGSLALLLIFIVAVVSLSGDRLADAVERLTIDRLERDARMVALDWSRDADPDALADTAGALLGMRVTLIGPDGRVLGDSEEPPGQLAALENHLDRPEVRDALERGVGWTRRASTSVGRDQLYVAVRAPHGVARVSIDPGGLESLVRRAQRSVLAAGIVALLAVAFLALLFARGVARPLTELRDVAQALAGGDLTRRPALTATGEVGDLGAAIHRMAEQLDSRMRALQAEEGLLAATIDSLSEGVVIVDERRRVVRANDAARRLLGLEESIPFPAERLPRDRQLRDALGDALAGSGTEETELLIGTRALLLRAEPLGRGGAVLTVRDVTAARRLEATRRDFVANVSHELKTPLTVIGGFAETLRDDDVEPEQRRRFADAIQSSAQRMQRVVDDLLDLSRIESGGWRPSPATLDVAAAVGDATLPCRPAAERKGLALETEIAPDASTVVADPTAIRQILGNLIDNAIRYTAHGRVTVFAERVPDGIRIGVRDTGAGIAREHLPRIFERFYRVDAARSREAGGTGLGLAIVKHLAEAHGGRVEADSVPNRGTTVAVVLPSVTPA